MKAAAHVAIGSGIGGTARVALSLALIATFGPGFPIATLAVNVFGSFAIGWFAALAARNHPLFASHHHRQFFAAGICGGFTTFSLFSLDTLQLAASGRLGLAALLSIATLVLGLLAVWLGHRLGSFKPCQKQ